jgi:hypothetical protein
MLRRVGVCTVGELGQQRGAEVDQNDAGGTGRKLRITVRHHIVHQLGQGARGLYPGRTASHHHEGERSIIEQLRLGRTVLEEAQHAVAHPFGIGD